MSNTYFENMELFDRITSEIAHYEQSEMSVAELIDSLRKIIGIKPTITEADIRAKAIDEFAEKLNAKIEEVYSAPERESEYNHARKTVCRIIQGNMEVIAEQLKGEPEVITWER